MTNDNNDILTTTALDVDDSTSPPTGRSERSPGDT